MPCHASKKPLVITIGPHILPWNQKFLDPQINCEAYDLSIDIKGKDNASQVADRGPFRKLFPMDSSTNPLMNFRALLSFNQQLQDLIAAGVQLHWRSEAAPSALGQNSQRIVNEVAVLVGAGTEFSKAFGTLTNVCWRYRMAVLAWAVCGHSSKAFGLLRPMSARTPQSRRYWFLGLQLGALFLLAFSVIAIWIFLGRVHLIYADSNMVMGPFARTIAFFYEHPSALSIVAVLFLGVAGAFTYFQRRLPLELQRRDRTDASSQEARWSRSQFIELLTEHGYSFDQADLFYHSCLRDVYQSGQGFLNMGSLSSPKQQELAHGWASVWGEETAFTTRLRRRLSVTPYAVFMAIGLCVVLGVGMTVFGPIIELLYALLPAGAFAE